MSDHGRSRIQTGLASTAILIAFAVVTYLFFPWHHGAASADVPLPKPVSISAKSLPAVTVPANFAKNTVALVPQKVTAPIDDVSVDRTQNLTIPGDVHRVGHYTGGGSLDGHSGDVLLAGHVNYVGQGTGAFGNIGQLHVGDALITRGTGAPQAWRVTSLASYRKADGLPAAIFRAGGPRQLSLVTCGGVLDRSIGSYESNIVVIAAPVKAVIAH